MGQIILVQLPDDLVHLLLLGLGGLVYIHGGIHEVPQGEEGFILLRADPHIPVAVGEDAVYHGGDAGGLRLAQHGGAVLRQGGRVQHTGPDGVLDVVVDVGDLVGHPHDAALRRRCPNAFCVGDDAVAHLPGQVEALPILLELVHHPQALHIVLEAAGRELVECPLSGVAEGGVAKVVGEADGLGQVLIEPQRPGDGAGDLGDFQRVGQAGAVEVALRREEDLRFLLEPPERLAVEHPVAVPLEHRADGVLFLRPLPAPACIAERRPRGQRQPLDLFGACAHIHPVSLLFLSFSLLSARGRSQCRVCGYCNRFALSKGENPCLFVRKCFDLSFGNFWYLLFFCLVSTLPWAKPLRERPCPLRRFAPAPPEGEPLACRSAFA